MPRGADLWDQLGVSLHAQGKDAAALDAYTKAVELDRTNLNYLGNRGATLRDLGRATEAVEALGEVVRRRPDDAVDRFNLGLAYAAMGDTEHALEQFREAARLDPSDPVAVVRQAVLLVESGKDEAAIPLWEEAARRAPGDSKIQHDLAVALLRLGRSDDAERRIREAVRLAPRDAESHALLGHLLMRREQFQEALEHLETSRQLDPSEPRLYFNCASVYVELGQEGRAVDLLVEAVGRFEKSAPVRFALAWILSDSGDLAVRNVPLAATHARQATLLEPTSSRNWLALGAALYRQQRFSEAIAMLEKSRAMGGEPREPALSHYLAMALAREGRLDDARAAFARAEAARAKPEADSPRDRQRAAEVEEVIRSAEAGHPPGGK